MKIKLINPELICKVYIKDNDIIGIKLPLKVSEFVIGPILTLNKCLKNEPVSFQVDNNIIKPLIKFNLRVNINLALFGRTKKKCRNCNDPLIFEQVLFTTDIKFEKKDMYILHCNRCRNFIQNKYKILKVKCEDI